MASCVAAEMEDTDPVIEPPVNINRSASKKSLDISHILGSTFKDLYSKDIIGKDTLSNLIKTKGGKSRYHEKYVEELQQAHAEYNQRMKELDMLESHIIRARAQAADHERRAYNGETEMKGDIYDHKGLLTVKSAYGWCVDGELLESNNLISPQDYLPEQKQHAPAPRARAAVTPNFAKPTIASTMHLNKDPQDDGYTFIPPTTVLEMNELDRSLTFESGSSTPESRVSPKETKAIPKWRGGLSMQEKTEALEKIQRMKDRRTFLRNPQFLPPNAQRGGQSLIQPRTKAVKTKHDREQTGKQSSAEDPVPVFLAEPPVVLFSEYHLGQIYETTLELKNVTSSSRHVRVLSPSTPYFSIGLGRFPGEGGIVAPGMSCKYTVQFAPDSLGDFEDFVEVEAQGEHLLVVPLAARRPPPVLTLPRVLDCGYCLVGGVKFVEFVCQNVGLSTGTFCIFPKSRWPASNLRPVAKTYFSENPPFAIGPSFFVLQPGESTVVEVVFFPTAAGKTCQVFTVVCDNCQVKEISIEGDGQQIALELVSVSGENEPPVFGEVRDLTAEHFVRFSPCNAHSVQQKKIIVRNNVHMELPFHWQILKPNLRPLLPWESPGPHHIQFHLAADNAFHVCPRTGSLGPCQDQEFLFTFSPKELRDYHSVCHLVLRDVPQQPPEPSEYRSSALQPVCAGSKVSDVIVMEIEVKGLTHPYKVLLEPYAIVIPGEILICNTAHRKFKMWNHSMTFICFQWERMNSSSHIIEVEPPSGRIEENECFDLDLIVTGGRPERVVASLVCHIENHHEPITLAVEVAFKGPTVTASLPSVDFGLMELGEQKLTTLLLTNTTQVEAIWSIEESRPGKDNTQILVEPCRGVLHPMASCSVDVFFMPRFSQLFETELELTVEDGTGCHLWVRANVQTPRACLLKCGLLLSGLYVGIPATATATLFNQTLLPANFSWMTELQGEQASLCAASFEPSSGTLGPNASADITVHFTSHTDLDLTEVAALCEVPGMKSPLVLAISTSKSKTLSVVYSLPNIGPAPDGESPSPLVLDFGRDVVLKETVRKQLVITNETAVPAPFRIEAEYFSCQASRPTDHSEKRLEYVKKTPLVAKKVEEKSHGEFVSSLLADGKGAAFLVLPNKGMLGPFESQTVDVSAYTDMWGEYRDNLVCKVGDLEPTLVPMLITVKGCPLYFQMTGPQAVPQNQGPIIRFGTHVSGGDTVSRSLRVNNPTMFDIRTDWKTYNVDEDDPKLVDVVVTYGEAFPILDADGNELMSEELSLSDGDVERTHSSGSERASTSLQSQTDMEREDGRDPKEAGLYPLPANKKLFTVHVQPHVGNFSDYPFCITPQQVVIPAKSSSTIHVSFTPLTLSGSARESKCLGVAQGFMSLDSKMASCVQGKVRRVQGLDLEPLRIDLIAAVKSATLLVQMEEDDGVLDFHASAADLQKPKSEKEVSVREFLVVKSLQLQNTTEMPLHFQLWTLAPFVVLKPQPRAWTSTSSNSPNGDSEPLVLQPQKGLQVKVAFHCALPLLDLVEQTEADVPPGVTLITDARGQRKLKFEQNLEIHYSNNSLQVVPLRAHLVISTLHLSTQSINFGFCFVGHMQMIEVNLFNHGAHAHWKSVIESDEGEPCVFSVTPDFGFLRSKERHVTSCSQCLHINFTPCENREFRATVVILSPLVKTPLTLQLQGSGSFDEEHRCD